jgi:hypothetical protein
MSFDFGGIPLDGQGEQLPQDFGYQGQWLLRDRIFPIAPLHNVLSAGRK